MRWTTLTVIVQLILRTTVRRSAPDRSLRTQIAHEHTEISIYVHRSYLVRLDDNNNVYCTMRAPVVPQQQWV
jgi:hypothetical protein